MPLNNEPCISRPTLIDLNAIELNHFLFMISLGKCNGSCNVVDELPTKICIPSETKHVNVKVFNVIKRLNEVKTRMKFHAIVNANSIVQHVTKNGIMINVNVSLRSIACEKKKIIVGILAEVFVRLVFKKLCW